MASMPGILSEWPWKPLGSFKYLLLAPWAIHRTYNLVVKDEKDISSFLIFPFLLLRMLHNQIWISLSRYRTAKGSNRIVDKGIEFDQVDRERSWDDQIIFNGLVFYIFLMIIPGTTHLPFWRTDGVILSALLHAGPVEFIYYWLHRALHHHYLYSRYHSHHHSSIATEPITLMTMYIKDRPAVPHIIKFMRTCLDFYYVTLMVAIAAVVHPFAEHIAYFTLFAIPLLTTVFSGTASIVSFVGYITYIDFMNNMGHCNFELIPKFFFSIFPPLKYFMYTPSFHSLHHTQFRTNYSLFMPFYDYVYGTMDKSSDTLYENSLRRPEDSPDVVHLTHLTKPDSIYHLRLGFAYLASKPYTSSNWYLWLMWPVTLWTMTLTWICGRTFVVERHRFNKVRLQTWAVPKYNVQYFIQQQSESINNLIEEAILEAQEKRVKVISLGLLNQGNELNMYGELYVRKHPCLKIKVVDGTSLAVAVVLNNIPKGTTRVLLTGNLTKVAHAVVLVLCKRQIKVAVTSHDVYVKLKKSLGANSESANLTISPTSYPKVWLVGDGLSEQEQKKAAKGTFFVPFSQFPPKKSRNDCFYHTTPAMVAPSNLENVDSCENWLPRRVMSAWRVAGIVHALEGWKENECGSSCYYSMTNIDKVWDATLRHGFKSLVVPTQSNFI